MANLESLLRECLTHPGLKGTELRDRIYAALQPEPKAAHEPVWHIQGAKDCEKCRGAGWLYGRELDNPSEDTVNDTMTKYSCDGEKCVALNRGTEHGKT